MNHQCCFVLFCFVFWPQEGGEETGMSDLRMSVCKKTSKPNSPLCSNKNSIRCVRQGGWNKSWSLQGQIFGFMDPEEVNWLLSVLGGGCWEVGVRGGRSGVGGVGGQAFNCWQTNSGPAGERESERRCWPIPGCSMERDPALLLQLTY